jgi:outer membrane protein assembly factor BamC
VLETLNVKLLVAVPFRPSLLTLVALAALQTGCSSLDGLGDDKLDYRSTAVKAKSLEVPPDLTQLARDTRYQPQAGVISASAAGAPPAAGVAPRPTVALNAQDGMRIERQGQARWLVVPQTPEVLWPKLRAFWEQRGLSIAVEDAKAGVLETSWAENRAKLPVDVIRSTIGRVFGNVYDTGERDQYRMRVERSATGSEIYIAHRGAEEVYVGDRRENTTWRGRPSDPQLEAEMLARLMVSLGAKDLPTAQATISAATTATPGPARARAVAGGAALEVDDPFDRAWRRVGLALDRGGFTVEDRDRTLGLYYVRYVDPKSAGKEEPGFWSRLMGESNPLIAVRYRIVVKAAGEKTVVAVLTSAGATDVGENGQRIATALIAELR